MSAEPDPSTCTDREWSEATGHCGGCGEQECHPGRACNETVCPWWGPICDTCHHRRDQGMHEHLTGATS